MLQMDVISKNIVRVHKILNGTIDYCKFKLLLKVDII